MGLGLGAAVAVASPAARVAVAAELALVEVDMEPMEGMPEEVDETGERPPRATTATVEDAVCKT